jgi:hypothetical protein
MGLFSKKKTTTENVKETTTQTKIVKLSYLQSIAISRGLISAEELTETEGSTDKITNSTLKNKNDVSKIADKIKNFKIGGSKLAGTIVLGFATKLIGKIGDALFGKKTTQDVNLTVTDSGWTVNKIWNEPQFDLIRYGIGIKELTVSQFTYETISEVVTKPWGSPKPIQKITLMVDQFIPGDFPPGNYIEYYVKADNEDSKWTRINPLDIPTVYDSSGNIVPRLLTFNSEKPLNSSLEESFIITSEPVVAVRLKIILKRPTEVSGAESLTPIVRSYRLLLTPVGGL